MDPLLALSVLSIAVGARPAQAASGDASGPPAGAAAAPAPSSASGAGVPRSADDPWLNSTLDSLLDRIQKLEQRNKQLEGEVATLRAEDDKQWLTEERVKEIRAVVADVLADADGRASLRQDSMTAGWNDGFFLASPDGRFKLQLGGLLQTRFLWSNIPNGQSDPQVQDRKQDRYGFDLPNTEIWAKGHVISPGIQYMLKARFTSDTATLVGDQGPTRLGSASGELQLMDAWVRFLLTDNWSIRAGQYRTPFSREFLIPEQNQMAIDRTIVDKVEGEGYTQGVELQYVGDDARFQLSVDDGGTDQLGGPSLAVVGTDPANTPWYAQQSEFSTTMRLEWKPFGAWKDFESYTSPMGQMQGWLLGGAFHYSQARAPLLNSPFTDTGVPLNTWIGAEMDTQYNFGGASVAGAFYYNYVDSGSAYNRTSFAAPTPIDIGYVNTWGLWVMGSIYVDKKWELFCRYELGNWRATDQSVLPVTLRSPGMLNLITGGVNYYIDGQDVKWTLDFGWSINELDPQWQDLPAGYRVSSPGEFVFRTRLQLLF